MNLKRGIFFNSVFFKLVLVLLVAFFTVSCGDSGSSSRKSSSVATGDPDTGADEPIIIDDPESEVNMKAVFLYDGSLKSFNDDKSLSVICDAETVVKLSDGRWIINDELKNTLTGTAEKIFPGNVKKACIYDGNVFAYTDMKKIYKIGNAGDVELFTENISGYAVALNDDGIAIGFTFYNPDGTTEIACDDFAFWLANKIIRVDTVGSYKKKSVKKDGAWTQISSGLYTNFVKFDALITDKKVIWPAGTTLDLETMIAVEPQFQSSTQKYISGNAFVQHFVKYTEQRWQPIGYIGDLAYFFYPKTGKVFKYAISGDVLTEWVKITDGTETDDITTNNNAITKTGCILVDNEIIYFDGAKINRINVETGEKVEIADATEFKGIVL